MNRKFLISASFAQVIDALAKLNVLVGIEGSAGVGVPQHYNLKAVNANVKNKGVLLRIVM